MGPKLAGVAASGAMTTSRDIEAAAEPVIDEVAGAARLAGALVDQLTIPVRDTHRALADRVFRPFGPAGTPVRLIHDGISGVFYASVRGGARLTGAAAGTLLAMAHGRQDRRSLSAHPRGAQALAFTSGLLGDWLEGRADDLTVQTTLTHHGRPVSTDPALLAEEVDAVTDRLVFLVHGLAETTGSWRWWPTDDGGRPVPSYPERLADEDWTPLEVGYNTGLPVTASGLDLATLVDSVVGGWPVPVAEVALVGHSMGGLVIGVACHHGVEEAQPWTDRVRHVVTLGTPHRGSWLAVLAARGAHTFGRLPETRGLGGILDLRSPGIRDLTEGWPGRPPVVGEGDDPVPAIRTLAELLPDAQHSFVASTLRTPTHPLSRLLGDGLVHPRSSTGPAKAGGPNVRVRQHAGVGHVRLVHHPAVADDLVDWLGPRTTPAPPR